MIRSLLSFRSLLYVVFALALTAVLLYVRFPAEKFKIYCEKSIERLLPGRTCSIEHIGYGFPLSAELTSIHISRVIDGQESDMVVGQLVISPQLPLFWRAFTLKGEMYSGHFAAELDIDRQAGGFQLTDVHLHGFQMGDFAERIGFGNKKISGVFEFFGTYQGKNSNPSDGVGKGQIEIIDGSMMLVQPIVALSNIDFEKLTVTVTQQNSIIKFSDGTLQGKDLVADFSGELRMASPLLNSSILFSGHLDPADVFLKSHPREQQFVQRLLQRYKMKVLPFKLGGTVKRPLFRFST